MPRSASTRVGSLWLATLGLVMPGALGGCRSGVAGCQTDDDCLADDRCIDGLCRIPCNGDTDCPEEHRCEGGVCEPGGRPIAAVLDGDDAIDHDAMSTSGYDTAQIRWYSTRTADYRVVVGGTCDEGTPSGGENAIGVATSNRPLISTLRAIDLDEGDNDVRLCVSANGSDAELLLTFIRDQSAPVSVASPLPGTHVGPLALTFNCADHCDRIAYTTDDSDPAFDADGELSVGQIAEEDLVLTTTTLLKYRAIDRAGNVEAVREGLYDLEPPPVVTVDDLTHLGVSATGYPDTTITWRTSRAGSYNVRLGPCDLGTATVLSTGSALADTPLDEIVAVADLPGEGGFSVRICVQPTLGIEGSVIVPIRRDDSPPLSAVSSPTPGLYADPVSVLLTCVGSPGTELEFAL